MRKILTATAVAISIPCAAGAATLPADGYIYSREVLSEPTEGCVAQAPGGVFVAAGPTLSFPASGGTRDILFLADGGAVHTVATGLNAVSDCVYDFETDTLYVTDSGQEFSGAVTGDTVFAIPGGSMSVPVAGLELLPSGSIQQAFGIDLFTSGLLVTNAVGGGAGTVIEVDLTGMTPATSTFASGFDYTGGVAFDGSRVVVSEAVQPSFESAIYQYDAAGAFQITLSGPTYDHGSIDVAIASDGSVVTTGAPTIARILGATVEPLVAGLDGGTGFDAFGGGVAIDDFTGRIDFLASSFSGADDDKSVHRLAPIARMMTGGGNPATDCLLELYGVEAEPGRNSRVAVCVDGDPCDGDGAPDGACTFPLGLCWNASDSRLDECAPATVAQVELLSAKPEFAELNQLVADMSAALPSSASSCVFSDGIVLPLRLGSGGEQKRSKATIRLRAQTDEEMPHRDLDVVRMICEPSAP